MGEPREPSIDYFLFEKLLGDLYMVYLEGKDDGAVLLEMQEVWGDMDRDDRKLLGKVIERVHHGITYKTGSHQ